MPRILGNFSFHTCNRCLLCNQLADLLLAERVPHLDGKIWASQTRELPWPFITHCFAFSSRQEHHPISCACRDGQEKKYNRIVVALQEVGTKPKKTEEMDGGSYFLLVFGCKEVTESHISIWYATINTSACVITSINQW